MNTRLRKFAEREAAVAIEWRNWAESKDEWVLGPPVGTGESMSLHVTHETGLCGIAKPAFQDQIPRAAHEKIASDLAYEVGVPVPPVLLWRNPAGGAPYAISLRAFAQPLTWNQASHLTGDMHFLSGCADAMATGYVFHVWIGDSDHGGNEGNILIDAQSTFTNPAIAFIDHAFSMSQHWDAPEYPMSHIGGYYMPYETLPKAAIAKAVEWVQNTATETIDGIVRRIPPQYLSENRGQLIVDCLTYRQRRIAEFFGI